MLALRLLALFPGLKATNIQKLSLQLINASPEGELFNAGKAVEELVSRTGLFWNNLFATGNDEIIMDVHLHGY